MLAAVEFDDQQGLRTNEVTDIAADWNLPSEAITTEPAAAQAIPQQALCLGRRTPEGAREVVHRSRR